MNIVFQKTPAYPLQPDDGSNTFVYLNKLTLQQIDPAPIEKASLHPVEDVILHSNLHRVTDSFVVNPTQTTVGSSELNEVKFSLKSLCTEDEWRRYGSVIVRERFVHAFISDSLLEKQKSLIMDVRKILGKAVASSLSGHSVRLISHSFKLKLIEAFILSGGRIVDDPYQLELYLPKEKKTYDFGEEFNFTTDEINATLT